MLPWGRNTLLGGRAMVCRLHSASRCSFSRVFTLSPNSEPSGGTMAARPLGRSSRMNKARNRSAVSFVRKCAGKSLSMPSSSRPPKGGLMRMMSTRSAWPWLMYGRANVLSCRTKPGCSYFVLRQLQRPCSTSWPPEELADTSGHETTLLDIVAGPLRPCGGRLLRYRDSCDRTCTVRGAGDPLPAPSEDNDALGLRCRLRDRRGPARHPEQRQLCGIAP